MKMFPYATLALFLSPPAALADDKPYTIGLAPTIAESFSKPEGRILSKYLSNGVKHAVESQPFDSYDALVDALVKGTIDFAWINPLSYVKASARAKIIPIAKALRHGDSYRSVIFVRADSNVKSISDLKGLKVAWVDRESTAGYLFPRALLLKNKLDPTELFSRETFAGTHKGVCEGVSVGAVDVGATFHNGDDPTDLTPNGCAISLGTEAASKLRGIAMSDKIPNEVVAARPDMDRDVVLRMGSVLAEMSQSLGGKQVLNAVFHAEGFGAALDSDFDTVREVATAMENARPPIEAAEAAATPVDELSPTTGAIHFASKSAEIISDSYPILDRFMRAMKRDPTLHLRIDGHSDSQGPDAIKATFARQRANMVLMYMLNAGIPHSRLTVKGFSDTKPTGSNDTEAGRAANRRVALTLVTSAE